MTTSTSLNALPQVHAELEATLAEVNRLGIVEACAVVKEVMRRHNLTPVTNIEPRAIMIMSERSLSVLVSSDNPSCKMSKVSVFNHETMFIMNVEGKYITVEQLRKLVEVAL